LKLWLMLWLMLGLMLWLMLGRGGGSARGQDGVVIVTELCLISQSLAHEHLFREPSDSDSETETNRVG
jgi:hypothetical protein